MAMDFPVEETVRARHSVRTYEDRPLSAGEKEKLNTYIASLTNPFHADVSFHLLHTAVVKGEKLGTYGIIKGASDFIGATVKNGEMCLEALGYAFEKLVLYATSLGLGTCWLGGTFKRSAFGAAIGVAADDLFPAISPVGHEAGKRRLTEAIMRRMAKSNRRKGWEELFFDGSFSRPLTAAAAGAFACPLEMVRLAPSAVNRQPWRILREDGAYHFYSFGKENTGRIDMGIAACHFHLAVLEQGLDGTFVIIPGEKLPHSEKMRYVFSWVAK